jgi:hypothetical protein
MYLLSLEPISQLATLRYQALTYSQTGLFPLYVLDFR